MNRRVRQATILGILALGMAAITTPARATLMVNVGGTIVGGAVVGGVTYTDNQAGVDVNPAIGVMDIGTFLDGTTVNFVINGFTATSASPIASMAHTSNADLSPAAPLPLAVDLFISDNGFTVPAPFAAFSQTVNLLSSVGGLTASATAVGYHGDSNVEFDVDGASTSTATSALAGGVSVNAPGSSGLIITPSPYSLTMGIHIDITARGADPIQNLQVNANLAATSLIPEPATVMLLGTGLLGLAVVARKKIGR